MVFQQQGLSVVTIAYAKTVHSIVSHPPGPVPDLQEPLRTEVSPEHPGSTTEKTTDIWCSIMGVLVTATISTRRCEPYATGHERRANNNTQTRYHYQPNFAGWTAKQLTGLGVKSGAFGGVALFAVIFFASGIPRVQKDILQKIPFIGGHFIKETPASDNPF
ncbi:hypothetical protein O1611_g10063 [Lasiodiplodia mahajangana]|uniref:Uncharacterized protein n=1 Tax=Lasiodiplodia mahajangana TaxID=1108764 RepID=A0ACC2J2N2_9PEZI|nr:hypothetical protein O1611_g10063 [Lasiodiplodia mahajangana]